MARRRSVASMTPYSSLPTSRVCHGPDRPFARGAVSGGLKRFSLRTLLIATTLVAVVLGAIVWLNHH